MQLEKYHYDKWKEDPEGRHSKILGVLDYDLEDEIAKARSKNPKEKWYNARGIYEVYPEIKEKLKDEVGANTKMFSKLELKTFEEFPKFHLIFDLFHLVGDTKFKFNDQLPGHILMEHVDNFPDMPDKEKVYAKEHLDNRVRFLVMLADWEPGQMAQFGNRTYTQWKKGTVFHWEFNTTPHSTANASWIARPALQITGEATEKTWEIIKNGL